MPTRTKRTRTVFVPLLSATLLVGVLGVPVAGSDRPEACPAKVGALKFSSAETTGTGERFAKTSCFYRSDDWDKQVTIRAAWISADRPDATLNLEPTYCLKEDEAQVEDRQYGEGTRLGRVFPTKGERFVLGSYLASPKGPSTAKIVKAARAPASSYAADAATRPAPTEDVSLPATPSPEPPTAADAETIGDEEIYTGIFDIAEAMNAAPAPAFDREAVATCLSTDPGSMSVALIEDSSHARTVNDACAVLPLLLEELPAEQATEMTIFIIALLVADEQRRQAETAATE